LLSSSRCITRFDLGTFDRDALFGIERVELDVSTCSRPRGAEGPRQFSLDLDEALPQPPRLVLRGANCHTHFTDNLFNRGRARDAAPILFLSAAG
jgi:hypothetical protein